MTTPPMTLRAQRGTVLSHPQDIHCLIFHLLTLVAHGCAFTLYLHPEWAHIEALWSRLAFVAGAAMMLGWISGIDLSVNYHNHTHRRIFRASWLNRCFGWLWTFSSGWPSFYWWHAHVVVHHANLLGPTDWTLPRRRADGSFENMFWYCLADWPYRSSAELWRDFTSGRGRPVSHSNTFLSRFFNPTTFNIGYHIEHHDYPALHWSELPAFHEQVKDGLIEDGAHILPFGYYRAGWYRECLMQVNRDADLNHPEFAVQHPDYLRRQRLRASLTTMDGRRAPHRPPRESPEGTHAHFEIKPPARVN